MKIFLILVMAWSVSSVYAEDLEAKFVGHFWAGVVGSKTIEGRENFNHLYLFAHDGTSLVAFDISISSDESAVKTNGWKPETQKLPAFLDREKGQVIVFVSGAGAFGTLYFCVLADGSLLASDGKVLQEVKKVPEWATTK